MKSSAFRHKKRFGQHFLDDTRLLSQIAECIYPREDDEIIEIGPGQGVLTELILGRAKKLDAIEIDRDLIQYLEKKFPEPNFTLHQGDILQFDLSSVLKSQHQHRIIGNLPYNISTPILFKLFNHLESIQDMHFLLQKEVVLRMTAKTNDKQYGRLSVMTQYFCRTQRLLDIPPEAFSPPPKVDSSVVKLVPHNTLPYKAHDFKNFSELVRDAFNHRRKTIYNSLKKKVSVEQLESINIKPTSRPQELSIDDFVRISNTYSKID